MTQQQSFRCQARITFFALALVVLAMRFPEFVIDCWWCPPGFSCVCVFLQLISGNSSVDLRKSWKVSYNHNQTYTICSYLMSDTVRSWSISPTSSPKVFRILLCFPGCNSVSPGAGEQQWASFGARPAVGSRVARQIGLLENLENSTGSFGVWVNCFFFRRRSRILKHPFGDVKFGLGGA